MPTPYDLLSSQLEQGSDPDPDDQLRNALSQNQGKNLVGGPMPPPGGPPPQGGGPQALQPVAPSAAVPGPLAALAGRPGLKPKIKPKPAPPAKKKIKPHIRPKAKKPPMPDGGFNGMG